jgi:hypothetical protein
VARPSGLAAVVPPSYRLRDLNPRPLDDNFVLRERVEINEIGVFSSLGFSMHVGRGEGWEPEHQHELIVAATRLSREFNPEASARIAELWKRGYGLGGLRMVCLLFGFCSGSVARGGDIYAMTEDDLILWLMREQFPFFPYEILVPALMRRDPSWGSAAKPVMSQVVSVKLEAGVIVGYDGAFITPDKIRSLLYRLTDREDLACAAYRLSQQRMHDDRLVAGLTWRDPPEPGCDLFHWQRPMKRVSARKNIFADEDDGSGIQSELSAAMRSFFARLPSYWWTDELRMAREVFSKAGRPFYDVVMTSPGRSKAVSLAGSEDAMKMIANEWRSRPLACSSELVPPSSVASLGAMLTGLPLGPSSSSSSSSAPWNAEPQRRKRLRRCSDERRINRNQARRAALSRPTEAQAVRLPSLSKRAHEFAVLPSSVALRGQRADAVSSLGLLSNPLALPASARPNAAPSVESGTALGQSEEGGTTTSSGSLRSRTSSRRQEGREAGTSQENARESPRAVTRSAASSAAGSSSHLFWLQVCKDAEDRKKR